MTSNYTCPNVSVSARRRISIALLCSFFAYFSPQPYADTGHVTLSLKPSECVVMEQGQACHATAKLSWSASVVAHYCLHSSSRPQPLKCWSNSRRGTYRESVVTKEAVQYTLTRNDNDFPLAKAKLNLAWVYRKSVRPVRQWRLF